jgi:hypothetical protein
LEIVLRALAEGKVRWAFWAPDTDPSTLSDAGDGIWIRGGDDPAGADSESDGEQEGAEEGRVSGSDEEGDDVSDEEEEEALDGGGFGGRFGALALEDAGVEPTEED